MRRPPALPDRPVIRVIHPCGTLEPHRAPLEVGLARLEAAGCEVRWDPARAGDCWRGYLAGTDDARAAEFVAALDEPGVHGVWFARGGSGGARIAERVARAAADRAPRVIVGFSDATVFLDLIASRVGWITFHGPAVTSLGHPAIEADLDAILEVLRGARCEIPFADADAKAGEAAPGAAVEGRLMGGNLTVLAASMGTPAAPDPVPDAIWLLEDVGEPPYRLGRSFWQLRAADALAGARALWLGDLGLSGTVERSVRDHLADDAALPLVGGAPAGHRGRLDILPIGGWGTLDLEARTFASPHPWVEREGR